MTNVAMPDRHFFADIPEDEESQIREMAKMQIELDMYARTHLGELIGIDNLVQELRKYVDDYMRYLKVYKKCEEKKFIKKEKKFGQAWDEIIILYKIFGRLITREKWMELYRIKFNFYTGDLNTYEGRYKYGSNPIAQKADDGYSFYKQIISEKIDKIIKGNNVNVLETFGEKRLAKAIKLIGTILKNGDAEFNIDKILGEYTLLNLLCFFDEDRYLDPPYLAALIINTKFANVDSHNNFSTLFRIYTDMVDRYWIYEKRKYVGPNDNNFKRLLKLSLDKIIDDELSMSKIQEEEEEGDGIR